MIAGKGSRGEADEAARGWTYHFTQRESQYVESGFDLI